MDNRYFYHSFPRRTINEPEENAIGLNILNSICDSGLLLTPEITKWKHQHADGSNPRVEELLQKRICFTELSPKELINHANNFGHFAIEFEIDALKKMGAIPVFYIPDILNGDKKGAEVGSILLIQLQDISQLIVRLKIVEEFQKLQNVPSKLPLNIDYPQNPSISKSFEIDTIESWKLIEAITHGLTPLSMLSSSIDSLSNFFYPADNQKHNKSLDYYRQREWKICLNLIFDGNAEMIRKLSESEKNNLLLIDPSFFSKTISFQNREIKIVEECSVFSNFESAHPLEYANRIIVPEALQDSAKKILSKLNKPPKVISLNDLLGTVCNDCE